MKVGIIGSGGREHAICQSIKKSSKIDKIFCTFFDVFKALHIACSLPPLPIIPTFI